MKYELLSLFAGISCKLYDDLDDNELLASMKTPFIMELLKGFHYVSFTCISLQSAAFFYAHYLCNVLHSVFNKTAYSKPYESCLFYAFGLLFFIINPYDTILSLSWFDKLFILSGSLMMLFEPLLFVKDVSIYKLVNRFVFILVNLSVLFFYQSEISDIVKYTSIYTIGYFLVSCIVQYYSLFVNQPNPVFVETEPLKTMETEPLKTMETEPLKPIRN